MRNHSVGNDGFPRDSRNSRKTDGQKQLTKSSEVVSTSIVMISRIRINYRLVTCIDENKKMPENGHTANYVLLKIVNRVDEGAQCGLY